MDTVLHVIHDNTMMHFLCDFPFYDSFSAVLHRLPWWPGGPVVSVDLLVPERQGCEHYRYHSQDNSQ